jgi:hypothetical protein
MSLPSNIVIMWSGAIIDIPDGWFLCDGQNGTPNLLNRFVVGSGTTYGLDSTGGSKDAIVVSHTHSISIGTVGNHGHSFTVQGVTNSGGSFPGASIDNFAETNTPFAPAGSHSHSLTINNNGVDGTDKNLPPYYALAYIMKGAE